MELVPCLTQESILLEIFEYAFSYLGLEDLAKILSISKRLMATISQSPRLFIMMLKKYYLSQNHLHPRVRRYFKILLAKRPKIDVSNLSGIAKEIYLLAEYRIQISKNLIRDVYCVKSNDIPEVRPRPSSVQKAPNALIERANGGEGWLLEKEVIPEFRKRTLATSYRLCEIGYKAFFKQFSADFLQDFKNGRTVLKAGCFLARRPNYEAHGGCVLAIFDSTNKSLFEMEKYRTSEELPTSGPYTEIVFQVTPKDLPKNIDLENCSMKLLIYGKDDRCFDGHYGSRFNAMYIRGDYLENPLGKI